jgi:hypothetical protein
MYAVRRNLKMAGDSFLSLAIFYEKGNCVLLHKNPPGGCALRLPCGVYSSGGSTASVAGASVFGASVAGASVLGVSVVGVSVASVVGVSVSVASVVAVVVVWDAVVFEV